MDYYQETEPYHHFYPEVHDRN